MDVRRSDEQALLARSAREFLERACPVGRIRKLVADPADHAPEVWQGICELGWTAIPFADEYGGLGMSLTDLCIVIEELGRFLVAEPFVSTVVVCGLATAHFGSEALKRRHLVPIAEGRRVMAYAETESGTGWDAERVRLTARDGGDHYVLDGTKLLVPYAHVADTLVVVGRMADSAPEQLTLFLVDASGPGIQFEPQETLGVDHRDRVIFQGVRVPKEDVLGEPGAGAPIVRRIHEWGATAKCAEMVGGAERVLEMTVEYAQQRRQFNRPIGSFQAVQHQCADMAVDVLAMRQIAYEAAWRCGEGPAASRTVAMAKAWAGEAYQRVCARGHQIHGAIGFTEDHELPLYFRHAASADLDFGDADHHLDRVASDLLGGPPTP